MTSGETTVNSLELYTTAVYTALLYTANDNKVRQFSMLALGKLSRVVEVGREGSSSARHSLASTVL